MNESKHHDKHNLNPVNIAEPIKTAFIYLCSKESTPKIHAKLILFIAYFPIATNS